MDTVVIGSKHIEGTVSAENHFPLSEDGSLVAVVGRGPVGDGIAAGQDDEGFHLAFKVNGCAPGVGDADAAEFKFVIGLSFDD